LTALVLTDLCNRNVNSRCIDEYFLQLMDYFRFLNTLRCKKALKALKQYRARVLLFMEKKLILVVSPPASGKTFVSMKLAENLRHVVYLDKDTLVPLSNVAFQIADEPNDREGPFFEKYLRDVEYEVILDLAFGALKYENIVLINAPFGKEIRNPQYISELREKLKNEYDAHLAIIWVVCSVDVAHQRMIERNSPRDEYKLRDWDKFVASQNFTIPSDLEIPGDPYSLVLFYNDNEEQFTESMNRVTALLEERKEKK
jgi:predicted kinase